MFCRVRPMLPKETEEFGEMEHIEFLGNDDKSVVITNVSCVVLLRFKVLKHSP